MLSGTRCREGHSESAILHVSFLCEQADEPSIDRTYTCDPRCRSRPSHTDFLYARRWTGELARLQETITDLIQLEMPYMNDGARWRSPPNGESVIQARE